MEKRKFKTTKRLSGSAKTYRKWADWDVDDYFVGEYTGSWIDKQYSKPVHGFKVLDAEFANKKLAKSLIDKDLALNSAGQLDKALEDLEEGTTIQITYNGKAEIQSGKYAGKESHLISVEMVEEDTGDADEDGVDQDYDTDHDDDDEEDYGDVL